MSTIPIIGWLCVITIFLLRIMWTLGDILAELRKQHQQSYPPGNEPNNWPSPVPLYKGEKDWKP